MDYGVKNSQGTDRVRVIDYNRPYRQKILNGPKVVKTSFVPTIDMMGNRQKVAITLDPDGNDIWSHFVEFDTNLKREDYKKEVGDNQEALEKMWQVRSTAAPSVSYLYLGFDENSNNQFGTTIRLLEHKYSVYKDLISIQTDPFIDNQGNKNETLLRYAPLIFLTVMVEKVSKDPTKKVGFKNTAYKTTPLLPHPQFSGYFGVEYNHAQFKPNFSNKNWEITLPDGTLKSLPMQDPGYNFPMYTDAEVAAMSSCSLDLESFNQPFSDEQIREKLNKFAIDIDAKDENGKALFPHKDKLAECLFGLNVNFLETKPTTQIPVSTTAGQVVNPVSDTPSQAVNTTSTPEPLFGEKELASDVPVQQTVTKKKEAPDNLPKEEGFNPDQPTPTGEVENKDIPSFLK